MTTMTVLRPSLTYPWTELDGGVHSSVQFVVIDDDCSRLLITRGESFCRGVVWLPASHPLSLNYIPACIDRVQKLLQFDCSSHWFYCVSRLKEVLFQYTIHIQDIPSPPFNPRRPPSAQVHSFTISARDSTGNNSVSHSTRLLNPLVVASTACLSSLLRPSAVF